MFKNFITLAYRHFVRSPLSSFIELFGMTAGLTVFLLVMLWVFNETGYDSFNEKADRIYRLEHVRPGKETRTRGGSMRGHLIKQYIPEVEKVVRFREMGSPHNYVNRINSEGVKNYYDIGISLYADNDFFDTFTFDFVAGDPKTALIEKNTAVITTSFAKTLFGKENAIGKVLSEKLTITGVVKDVPNFHIPFKMIKSFVSLADNPDYIANGGLNTWKNRSSSATYLLLNPAPDVSNLEEKIANTIWTHLPEAEKDDGEEPDIFYLRPLKDIYFNSHDIGDTGFTKYGDRKKLIAYSSIACITLLLACINFINLNNAKYFERIKEVGIKKVCGASRIDVFVQFLGEVLLLCLISLILAVIFSHSILPFFNELVDTTLSIDQLFYPIPFIAMFIGLAIISLISGGFPAIYISSFQPVLAIKGLTNNIGKGFNFKKVNLVIQFSLSIILLIGSITAFRQVNFMKNADLGFAKDKAHRIVFDFGDHSREKVDAMKRRLLFNPNVLSVSHAGAMSIPGENRSADRSPATFLFDGIEHQLAYIEVDEDFKETLGLEMLEGRLFEKGRAGNQRTESSKSVNVILNEAAVKAIGLENPVGTKISNRNFRVIGVIKDFHLNSVDIPIEPMCFVPAVHKFKVIAKISSKDLSSTLEYVRTEVARFRSEQPKITFLDDIYIERYGDDDNFASLIGYFTALAILIACLGLLGVATHAIKLRIKEIGIRKTMGASSLQILRLLTAPFIKTIIISSVLAVPIGMIAMKAWLENYPYRTDLPWWVFGIACGLTVVIAAFTIIWQSWRASSQNPARLIRYE